MALMLGAEALEGVITTREATGGASGLVARKVRIDDAVTIGLIGAATGVSSPESWITLAQVAAGSVRLPKTGLVTFKSVGSALQDLTLATRYYELLRGRRDLPAAGDLASLKKPVGLKK